MVGFAFVRWASSLESSFVFLRFLIFLVVSTAPASYGNVSKAESTLRFLSIIHRHGDRAPIIFPGNIQNYKSLWPEGAGELRKIGIKHMFEVGKFLRQRYDGFIPSKYKASEVSVISRGINRCIMSAQSLLAGLYPPVEDQIWSQELLWQPVPVFTLDVSTDKLLYVNSAACPLLRKEHSIFHKTLGKWLHIDRELVEYLANHTGSSLSTTVSKESDVNLMVDVYDFCLIMEESGHEIPEWAKSVYPDKIRNAANAYWDAYFGTEPIRRIISGVLINDILTDMKKKREEEDAFERRLTLYSAHDVTIFSLWRCMDIQEPPPEIGYGALFIIELHKIDGRYTVKIFYKNNATDEDVTPLHTAECPQDGPPCDLDVLSSSLKAVTITNHEKECQIKH